MSDINRDYSDVADTVILPENEYVGPIREKRKNKSNVWDYFEKKQPNRARCNFCAKEFKVKYSCTSSLTRHLKSVHSGLIVSRPQDEDTNTDSSTNRERISYLDINSDRAKSLTNAIATMIAKDLQPYSIVNDMGFRSLMQVAEPRYKIPSRTTFSREIIPKMYEELKLKIKNIISVDMDTQEGCNVYAYTTDGWTSRAVQSYMSLTIHYINKDFDLVHYMLNLRHVQEKHTHKNIQNSLLHCMNEWNMDIEKRAFFTTDNGRNIAKAIGTYSYWTRIPCFAHSLQLIINAAMDNFQYENLRKKSRGLVGFFSRSSSARDKLIKIQQTQQDGNVQKTPLQLIQAVDTRWNTTYAMFKRLKLLRTPLSIVLSSEDSMPENLTGEEWNFLDVALKVLEPIQEATEIMSGDLYPTISQYYPLYFGLLNVLEGLTNENDNTLLINLSCSLRNALKQRFEPIVNSNTIYIYSMLVDPRFKDQLIPVLERRKILENFSKEISVLLKENENVNPQGPASHNEAVEPDTTKRTSLFTFFDKTLGTPKNKGRPSTFQEKKEYEIQAYFAEGVVPRGTNILNWWKINTGRFPILCKIAKYYLAIPATQVTSERLFSLSGNVVTATRSRLLPENIQQICFLHKNLR